MPLNRSGIWSYLWKQWLDNKWVKKWLLENSWRTTQCLLGWLTMSLCTKPQELAIILGFISGSGISWNQNFQKSVSLHRVNSKTLIVSTKRNRRSIHWWEQNQNQMMLNCCLERWEYVSYARFATIEILHHQGKVLLSVFKLFGPNILNLCFGSRLFSKIKHSHLFL